MSGVVYYWGEEKRRSLSILVGDLEGFRVEAGYRFGIQTGRRVGGGRCDTWEIEDVEDNALQNFLQILGSDIGGIYADKESYQGTATSEGIRAFT